MIRVFEPDGFLIVARSQRVYGLVAYVIKMDKVLLTIVFAVNVVSLVFFGLDKLWSMRGGVRVSESRLLLLAFVGPFGAFLSMLLFRHKTRKSRFLLVPLFLLFQLVLMFYFRVV